MKSLKHIKLFEAFESIKLSKTMRFINKTSKAHFLNSLNQLANTIDFPISELKDEYFEYLPFRSALKRSGTPPEKKEPEECNHQSDWIKGEFCKAGHVKRTWGGGTRIVKCEHCSGTGFKKARPVIAELQLIKFWFTKDGEFVTVTGTDGVKREQNKKGTMKPPHKFSTNINDYNIGGEITLDELSKLPTGAIIKCSLQGNSGIAMVWRGVRDGRTYIIQNWAGGNSDDDSREWNNYASYSWVVMTRGDIDGNPTLLEPKDFKKVIDENDDNEEDPYTINNLLNSRTLTVSSDRNMEDKLKNANFAIVLDFKKLKSGEYTKKTDISRKRKEQIQGSLSLVKPQDVKDANINRYIKELVNKFDIGKGLSEITKVMPRAFGWDNSQTFILYRGINISEVESLIEHIYEFIKSTSVDDKINLESRIRAKIKRLYEVSSESNSMINKNIEDLYKKLESYRKSSGSPEREEIYKNSIKIFESYLQLGVLINDNILKKNIESISDMEISIQKIYSLRNIFSNNRLKHLRRLRGFVENLGYPDNGSNAAYTLWDISCNSPEKYLIDLEEFKKIISKI